MSVASPSESMISVQKRKRHFIFVVDASGSMIGNRIASLNYAIRASIPVMQDAAHSNPEIDIYVQALSFSDIAKWITPKPIPLHDFTWKDIDAGGESNLGAGLRALSEHLALPIMKDRQVPPVIVLLSDGLPTDDVDDGLDKLLASELGSKATRLAIAIGNDANLDVLKHFIANPKLKPLRANNAEALANTIQWATSVPLRSSEGSSKELSDFEPPPEKSSSQNPRVW